MGDCESFYGSDAEFLQVGFCFLADELLDLVIAQFRFSQLIIHLVDELVIFGENDNDGNFHQRVSCHLDGERATGQRTGSQPSVTPQFEKTLRASL
jgi:hypothetical protein